MCVFYSLQGMKRALGEICRGVGVVRDLELKLKEVQASHTLVERGNGIPKTQLHETPQLRPQLRCASRQV